MTSSVGVHDGRDLIVRVPPGTFVRSKAGKVLGDLVSPGQQLLVADPEQRAAPRGAN